MMFRTILSLALIAGAFQGAIAQNVDSESGKLSYAIGYQIGNDFKARDLTVDVETVNRGIRDALAESEPLVPAEEMFTVLREMQESFREEQLDKFKKLADDNKARSDEYLATNRSKDGIRVIEASGVQYRVIEQGSGPSPTLDSEVVVHYRGSRMDGFEFDSSYARGVPATFKVADVLSGWQEVLPRMRVGARWEVFLPPEHGFGLRGQRPVGPNEAIKFEIELVEIKA